MHFVRERLHPGNVTSVIQIRTSSKVTSIPVFSHIVKHLLVSVLLLQLFPFLSAMLGLFCHSVVVMGLGVVLHDKVTSTHTVPSIPLNEYCDIDVSQNNAGG